MEQLDLNLAFTEQPPALDFVFGGLLAGTVGNISAPGSTGKSFLALETALTVACPEIDDDLLQLGVHERGKVIVFNAEDPREILSSRLFHIHKAFHEDFLDEIRSNLTVIPLVGKQPNIANQDFQDQVIAKSLGVRLLVFDTLTRFHNMNENDNGQMSQVVGYFERIAAETGAAVLFLHHASKGAALNGQQAEQQASRGASAITDNCRWQGFLQGMSADEALSFGIDEGHRKGYVRFGANKENYGKSMADRWLMRCDGGVLRASEIMKTVTPAFKVVKGGKNRDSAKF